MEKRKVQRGGIVSFNGLIYEDARLQKFVGDSVLVMPDDSINNADLGVFDSNKEFICNAQNSQKWNALIADAGLLKQ
ncbi:MAG: Mu transposase C-terminal domain-containing protein [Deltaproteobacteria bacterium]|nr:Mu transposase C-terminal domain-containing protein [Deltaproteobacteria bacterium]